MHRPGPFFLHTCLWALGVALVVSPGPSRAQAATPTVQPDTPAPPSQPAEDDEPPCGAQ